MRAGKLYFIVKGGQGSENFGHGGRPGEVGGSASSTPECSVDIKTQKEAEAYWKEKFVTGSPHKIEGYYGTRKFTIYVNFVRNHAYTENVDGNHGASRDHKRQFSLQRAQAMDAIWEVLKNPSAITWSQSNPLNKQFDKQLQAENERFGRVILSPTPTPEELAAGVVTHYDFVSWHEPNSQQYKWALNVARNRHVSPTRMKKALSFNRAFMLPRTTIILPSDEALPAHEGVTFNCASSFKGSHSPESKRSDRFHENNANIDENSLFGKAMGPDERWITVHPNGNDVKGVPVLIREHKDGTATVIGGAGGKLNHLKLRGIRPESDYKETLRQKEKERREARKQQIAADKASGVHALKQEQRKKLSEQVKNERAEFVRSVAKLAGWKPEEVNFDEEKHASLSPEALKKAREDHEKALFRKAKETVDINRKRLIEDADARAQAGLGEVPLQSDSDEALSVQDIAPLPEINAAKLGFNPEYSDRSGLTEEQAKEEAAEFVPKKKNSSEDDEAKQAKKELHEKINEEIDEFTKKNPDSKPPDPRVLDDAKKAAELLKAHKRLKMIEASARTARRELDSAQTVESKAMVIEVDEADIDKQTRQEIEDCVRTAGARSFLAEMEKHGGENTIAGHVATGSFNALNGAALAIGGDALIDRSVVDVLGVAGAAQVLARRLYNDMGDDVDHIRQALEAYHVNRSDTLQKTALDSARQLYDAAAAIELPEASNGFDLAMAQEANHKRRNALAEANKILGQAHGEMMAGATLVAAMQKKPTDPLEAILYVVAKNWQ